MSSPQTNEHDSEVETMFDLIDISLEQNGSLVREVLKYGSGKAIPPNGSKVKVHYIGTFSDGTKFDSSRDRGEPFEFVLGRGNVIKGWDLCVASMRKGEISFLNCSPAYAYGESGNPPTIPPNRVVNFEIELLDWTGEDLSPNQDGGIEKVEVYYLGDGFATPNDGAQVDVHFCGKYEGRKFDDRHVQFTLGEGAEANVIEGIDIALATFRDKESVRLIIKSKYAFGKEGHQGYGIPPDATVEYIVSLKAFERAKESWTLDIEEKIAQCKLFKDRGTYYFKTGKYALAIKLYTKIQAFLENELDTENKERQALLLASSLNVALCNLKMKNHFEARAAATKALTLDSQNVKALFRRGQALLALGEAELAFKDFTECLKFDPDNSSAKSQQGICKKILRVQLQKEKKIYANMFDKFAKMDTQREENAKEKEPNVMSCVGEWGKEDREREPSEFEKENPNILMLNSSEEFKDM